MSFGNIASMVNEDTLKAADEVLLEGEKLKVSLDNADTIKVIEESRKALIEGAQEQSSHSINGDDTKAQNRQSAERKTASSYSSTNNSYSGPNSVKYGSSYQSGKTKEDEMKEKAAKFAADRAKSAIKNGANSAKSKWDMISSANDRTEFAIKTAKERERDQKKENTKDRLCRIIITTGRAMIEHLHYISKMR